MNRPQLRHSSGDRRPPSLPESQAYFHRHGPSGHWHYHGADGLTASSTAYQVDAETQVKQTNAPGRRAPAAPHQDHVSELLGLAEKLEEGLSPGESDTGPLRPRLSPGCRPTLEYARPQKAACWTRATGRRGSATAAPQAERVVRLGPPRTRRETWRRTAQRIGVSPFDTRASVALGTFR